MKVSEVTATELMEYARVDDITDTETVKTFELILLSIKSFVKGYTGLTDADMDTKDDLTILLLVLSNEMYENRIYSVQNDKVNKVIYSILNIHSRNLL